jgi:hypothetical protein
MELKGKALTDFWVWYLLPEQKKTYKTNSLLGSDAAIKVRFLSLSFTERYGVFVDFLDSIEYEDRTLGIFVINKTQIIMNFWNQTFETAGKEAIKKANEIFNNQ